MSDAGFGIDLLRRLIPLTVKNLSPCRVLCDGERRPVEKENIEIKISPIEVKKKNSDCEIIREKDNPLASENAV